MNILNVELLDEVKTQIATQIDTELFAGIDRESYAIEQEEEIDLIKQNMPDTLSSGYYGLQRYCDRGGVEYRWTDLAQYEEFLDIPSRYCWSDSENEYHRYLLHLNDQGKFKSVFRTQVSSIDLVTAAPELYEWVRVRESN